MGLALDVGAALVVALAPDVALVLGPDDKPAHRLRGKHHILCPEDNGLALDAVVGTDWDMGLD